MAAFDGPAIVRDGLITHLDAANPRSYAGSGTSWLDVSGRSNHGTLVNTPTYSSSNLGYLSFNGSTNHATTTSSLTLTTGTMLVWLWRNGTQSAWTGLVYSRAAGGSNIAGLSFSSDGATLSYTWGNGGTDYNWATGLTTPNQGWCMAAVSVGASTTTMYLNGGQASQAYTPGTLSLASVYLAQDTLGGRFFNGYLGAVKIYNRALSTNEIAQNFNALRGRYGL
jgi:hypothetical protein